MILIFKKTEKITIQEMNALSQGLQWKEIPNYGYPWPKNIVVRRAQRKNKDTLYLLGDPPVCLISETANSVVTMWEIFGSHAPWLDSSLLPEVFYPEAAERQKGVLSRIQQELLQEREKK